jgi:hypothetical protein
VAEASKSFPTEERTEQRDAHNAGQTTQQRDNWIPDQQQRRREGHQEQMFDHVRAEKNVGESVERRSDRDPDDRKTEEERDQPPGWEQRAASLANSEPSASVDDGAED